MLATLAMWSCGGAQSGDTLRGIELGDTVEAPARSAAAYTTEASGAATLGDQRVASVERGVRAAASAEGVVMTGDGRLALLAAWVAERLGPGGRLPPAEVTAFFAHHLGLAEPTPHLLLTGVGDPATLENAIADGVSQYLRRQRYDAYGAVVVERQNVALAVVALAVRPFDLVAVPRHLATGASLAIRGRLHAGWSRPSVIIVSPGGATERLPAGAGPEFAVTVPTNEPGRYQIELTAEGPSGPSVLAKFPVFVGVDVPDSIRLGEPAARAGANASEIEAELFGLLQDERQRAGVPPLARLPGADEVARAHSRDMEANDFVGHRSPTTGEPAARLQNAGFQSGLVLENIGRGSSARTIHQGLMDSPGHRANILNPDVTHVGIGVVAEPVERGNGFLATQVFFRVIESIDANAAPDRLLASINEARAARGAAPLELDPNLQSAAAQAAHDFFAQPSMTQQEAVDQASGALRRFAIAFRRLGGVMAVVTQLDEAGRLEPTFEPGLRYVGIGVAQGTRPDLPPNSIAVVIMMAWPRN